MFYKHTNIYEENMENNPLKQYFRRPAVYLKLPSKGIGYPEGTLDLPPSGELPVYPMTAIDEITARTPDALFNGVAIVELIKSCVPGIKDPWFLLSNDIDAILLGIKVAAGGENLEVETECPKCKEKTVYGYNLGAALSNISSGDYDSILEINELKIKFRPVSYKEMNKASIDQIHVQKSLAALEAIKDVDLRNTTEKGIIRQIADITFGILSKSIEYIETPNTRVVETAFISDFLQNCDKTTYSAIRNTSVKLKESTELKPESLKCVSCGHEYQQMVNLNASDFFG